MNFMTMEYFITVAAARNFTQAAEELHITQQTLSAHIAHLESELDCQLFIRTTPLKLTYAGEVLLRHANKIHEGYLEMWNEFNDLTGNQRGKLMIGINYLRSRTVMPIVISEFRKQYPNIEVHLHQAHNDLVHQDLATHDIDLAIARFPNSVRGVEIENFYTEEVVMLGSNRLLGQESSRKDVYLTSVRDYQEYPFIAGSIQNISSQYALSLLKKDNISPRVVVRSDDIETMLGLCFMDNGLCFCPLTIVNHYFSEKELRNLQIFHFDPSMSYAVQFGYRKNSYTWKMVKEFIRVAKECVPQILQARHSSMEESSLPEV